MGRYYDDEFIVEKKKDLCHVLCPNCSAHFLVIAGNIGRYFKCVKCGSDWYAKRKSKD